MDDAVMNLLGALEARARLQNEALAAVGQATLSEWVAETLALRAEVTRLEVEIGGVTGFVYDYAEQRQKNLWQPTDREHLEGVHAAYKVVKEWAERVLAGDEA